MLRRTFAILSMLWLAAVSAACGGGGSSPDLGVDLAMVLSDGSVDLTQAADLAQSDASSPADLAQSGACVLMISNAVGSNVTGGDLDFPFMFAPSKGLQCNDAVGPTSCSVSPNGMTGNVYWTVYAGLGSLVAPVSVPFISSIAAQPDTAIMLYTEGPKRWTAQAGGTFTLEAHSGHSANLHYWVHLQPDPNGAAGATGTFDVSALCTAIDFRP